MAEIRIETGHATLEQFPTGASNEFTPPVMEQEIINYWQDINNERLFLIPYWKAARLIAQSPSQQIALRVTHIEDPALVDAQWISYDPANPGKDASVSTGGVIGYFQNLIDILKRQLGDDPPVALFVFGEELFPLNGNEGLKQFRPHRLMSLVGRIGRQNNGNTNPTAAFILAGQIDIKIGPGSGGGGATSGAKIPPGGNN